MERIQKIAHSIILGPSYQYYDQAQQVCRVQTLKQRRLEICQKFVKQMVKKHTRVQTVFVQLQVWWAMHCALRNALNRSSVEQVAIRKVQILVLFGFWLKSINSAQNRCKMFGCFYFEPLLVKINVRNLVFNDSVLYWQVHLAFIPMLLVSSAECLK